MERPELAEVKNRALAIELTMGGLAKLHLWGNSCSVEPSPQDQVNDFELKVEKW